MAAGAGHHDGSYPYVRWFDSIGCYHAPHRRSPTRNKLVQLQSGPLHGPGAVGTALSLYENTSRGFHSRARNLSRRTVSRHRPSGCSSGAELVAWDHGGAGASPATQTNVFWM